MRTLEITYTAGNRARYNLCFVEYIRQPDIGEHDYNRIEREVVALGPDDPVYDYAASWIKDGYIPVAPACGRLSERSDYGTHI